MAYMTKLTRNHPATVTVELAGFVKYLRNVVKASDRFSFVLPLHSVL